MKSFKEWSFGRQIFLSWFRSRWSFGVSLDWGFKQIEIDFGPYSLWIVWRSDV